MNLIFFPQPPGGITALAMAAIVSVSSSAAEFVWESARNIPIAYEVDVVVVGGSSGAASAAIAAAEAGAKVFLLAPRSYLGDDLCETRRLWLEPGEEPLSPLAKKLFTPPAETPASSVSTPRQRDPASLPFTYQADLPSNARHRDTSPSSRLSDGLWSKPETESVQYDGDVTITADLRSAQWLREARLVLFHRSGGDFNAASVAVHGSADAQSWRPVALLSCPEVTDGPLAVSTPVTGEVRYVRFHVKRAEGATRVLLGEVELIGRSAVAATPVPNPAPSAPAAKAPRRLIRPMHIKRSLDEALLEAKVDFLFGCYPTELLRDGQGKPCGIIMANRAGRQAVLAGAIIDATPRATVARLAGAGFAPYPAGPHPFTRIVIGGEPKSQPNVNARILDRVARTLIGKGATESGEAPVIEYTLRLPMRDASFAAFAAADQLSRDLLWHPGQLDLAEGLWEVPPDPVRSAQPSEGPWLGAATLDLDSLRPKETPRLWILGGCAEVTREAAAQLLRPLALMELGARVGQAAALESKALPRSRNARVADLPALEGAVQRAVAGGVRGPSGDTRELLVGIRPTQRNLPSIAAPRRAVPVLGEYDCVVVGGGTGGAPAGIGASRGGAKTLLIEYINGLGGVGTQGRISSYYHGYRGGFTAQVDAGIKELGATNFVVGKSEWWRQANRKAGTEIWLGVLGCGAFVADGLVKGVVVATPLGRGVVLAKTIIDATGNADIAAAAGAVCDYTGSDDVGVQGAGLPPVELGDNYTNTDWSFADDTDVVDFWHHYVMARQKFRGAHDLGQLVDTRERRRIVGEVVITPMDILLERTWPDTVNQAISNFDTHGFTVHSIFFAMPPDRKDVRAFVPLRALLPRGLDGIVVTGLGASAHRDAMPIIRMQADVQNQGYACGRAAAMVAPSAASIRQVDLKALQQHLVETGCLPKQCLTDEDSFPRTQERIAAAVSELIKPEPGVAAEIDSVLKNRGALATVFAHEREAVPLLEQAQARTSGETRLAYAIILGLMSRASAAETLAAAVAKVPAFDQGWNYTGMGQFGRSVSELDAYIIALGRTRDARALEVILAKVKQLDASKEFSHHRACAMALETLRDRRAAPVLADLLRKPGLRGHAFTTIDRARAGSGASRTETKPRNDSLRELILARALFRCGDQDGLGAAILEEYSRDLRGHYARHARAVLDEAKGR